MTDYLAVFAESFERATKRKVDGQEFLEKFYDIFMSNSEEIAAKFEQTDMARQRKHLLSSLNHMIYFSIDRRSSAELERVSKLHGKGNLDVRPALYEVWLESLLEAVRLFDTEFDEDIDLAWRVVLAPGIAYMKAQSARTR